MRGDVPLSSPLCKDQVLLQECLDKSVVLFDGFAFPPSVPFSRKNAIEVRRARLFEGPDEAYRESVIPSNVTARVSVEMGATFGWERYIGLRGCAIGMKSYGASAPFKDLLKKLPEELSAGYRSNVKRFLVHLEEQGQSWSQLVPAGSGPGARPAALEQSVPLPILPRRLE